jgi:predicted HTH transcriptional regulator
VKQQDQRPSAAISAARFFQWIDEGEHEQQDFKETISSSKKIARTLCAFANTRGGRILIGVRDNRSLRGIKVEEEQHMMEAAATFFCRPTLDIQCTRIEIGRKILLAVSVAPSSEKPVYALGDDNKWWVHIRVGDKTLLASKTVVDALHRSVSADGRLIQLGSKEEGLLRHLAEHRRVTLKEFARMMNISTWRARQIVVGLISAGLLEVHTGGHEEFYTLA